MAVLLLVVGCVWAGVVMAWGVIELGVALFDYLFGKEDDEWRSPFS